MSCSSKKTSSSAELQVVAEHLRDGENFRPASGTKIRRFLLICGRFKGFTLVELMVAVSVLSLMILFLFSVFNQATQAWQASEKKVDAFREARAALYVMRRDISGAMITTNISLNSNLVPSKISLQGQMQSTNSLFFIATQSLDAQGNAAQGDLCTIGYYVAWSTNEFIAAGSSESNFGRSRSYNLFRYFKDSAFTYGSMSNYLTTGAMTNLFPGASPSPVQGDEVLARNVIAFSAQPYYRDGAGVLQVTNGAITNNPAYIDVSLTVINYDTAAKLGDSSGAGANWNTNTAPANIKDLIQKNQQDFHTRIPYKP